MGLTNLRLRTLLYSGIGGIVAIAVLVAGFGIERLNQAGAAVASLSFTAEATARLDGTILQFETIRRAVRRFRVDGDPDAMQTVREALGKSSELLKLSADGTTSDERRKSYQALEQDVQAYAALFERQVRLVDQAAAQREKLFAGGDKLTKAARQLLQTAHAASGTGLADAASDVERAIFELRVEAWRFLAIRDPRGPMLVTAARAKVGGTLIKLDEVADDATRWMIAPVSMATVLFGESFDDLEETTSESSKTFDDDMTPRIIAMRRRIESDSQSLMAYVEATKQSSERLVTRATYLQIAITAVTMLLGLGLAAAIGRSVMQPLTQMTAAMLGLSSGDMEVPIPAHDRKDEVGDMARAVVVFRRNMILANNLGTHHAKMQADTEARQAVMRKTSATFETAVTEVMDALMAAAGNVFGVAGVMTDASAVMNEKSSATSSASLKASEDLTEVVGTIELLTSGLKGTVRGVTAAAQLSRQAVQRVETSQDSIRDLGDATGLIADVVRSINDIARQTNMLALNATIEAARAGEAGRGFAVVAMEVKALAGQTARAIGQIGGQIDKVRNTTETAVVAMKEIGGMISQMDEVAMQVAEGVGEQSLTTEGVAREIKLVSTTTAESARHMASLISDANVQSLQSSEGMLFGVTDIGQEVERLREIVQSYITHVTQDITERRQFGRLDGADTNATVLVPGQDPIHATIEDISTGGLLLQTSVALAGGTHIAIDLPGPGGTVSGMVIRCADDRMSITISDDEATRARIASVMDAISNALIVNPVNPSMAA